MLSVGDKAPGKFPKDCIVYFYPKDDTPGCTKEACSFRDSFQSFSLPIFGVSADSEASHEKFKEKYNLPFTLIADPDKELCKAFGVWRDKTFMGKTFLGIKRTTFLIRNGKIAHIFENVRPDVHIAEVLEKLKE